jgi:tetratricopeptide (TPR) repeat protein
MTPRTPRTLLEALIIERHETFEEFSEAAAGFARENGEEGTLSPRHAQRLASGVRADGRPLGPVRPATARLLERMLDRPIGELLDPPTAPRAADEAAELVAQLAAARGLDLDTVAAFRQRLDLARVLDRRLGAMHLVTELSEEVRHMQRLARYSTDGVARRALAEVIADACALLGWQWLDKGDPVKAWDYYAEALTAAAEAESDALRSYVLAAQSVVLLDVGDTATAVHMTERARESSQRRLPMVLSAWLAAAHGEALAAHGLNASALRAFRDAESHLARAVTDEVPFLVFGDAHLMRWHGGALSRMKERAAGDVLGDALANLPRDYARAETGIRVDMALAFAAHGDREAAGHHADRADQLAERIGSIRHRKRVARLRATVSR